MLKWCLGPTFQRRNDVELLYVGGELSSTAIKKEILLHVLKKVEIKNASFAFIEKTGGFYCLPLFEFFRGNIFIGWQDNLQVKSVQHKFKAHEWDKLNTSFNIKYTFNQKHDGIYQWFLIKTQFEKLDKFHQWLMVFVCNSHSCKNNPRTYSK